MSVNRDELEKAVSAALTGPEVRGVTIEDYSFNVKPATITRDGNAITVVGGDDRYISRRRRLRPNDQIFYAFDKVGDEIRDLDIDIDRGGFKAFVSRGYLERLVKISAEIIKIFLEVRNQQQTAGFKSDEAQKAGLDAAYQESKKLLDGSWEGEASFLIANIALRAE